MKNHRYIRGFSKQTETYKMTVSHEAASLHIKTINSLSNQIHQKIYCDFNLPSNIKKDTQTVEGLYDYLINNTDMDIQINSQLLKQAKDDSLQQSDRHHLSQNQQIAETFQQIDYGEHMVNHYQASNKHSKSNLENITEKLTKQNKKLKKQIALLQKRQRQAKMLDKNSTPIQTKKFNFSYKNLVLTQNRDSNCNIQMLYENQDFDFQIQNPVDIKLTANKKCAGFCNYNIIDNKITKITQKSAILTFKQTVNRSLSKRLRIKIQSQLANNWIIIGLLRKQLINRQFCYFIKNSIAYSGSMGIIFVDHDALDIGITISRGDLMQVVIDNKLHLVQWMINKQLICVHKIPESMLQHKLYPFIMLAHSRDSVRINIPASQ